MPEPSSTFTNWLSLIRINLRSDHVAHTWPTLVLFPDSENAADPKARAMLKVSEVQRVVSSLR